MISKPKENDPIETLLEKISKEAEQEEKQRLATFLQRSVARVIDTAVVVGVAYGAQLLFVKFAKSDNTYNVAFLVKSIEQAMPAFALIVWAMVYSPVMESMGGTLGKRLMRIQLVDLNTRTLPQFRYCMARSWIYLVFVVLSFFPVTLSTSPFSFVLIGFGPAVLSCLAFFISDYHQTWHDKLTNMICVKKRMLEVK